MKQIHRRAVLLWRLRLLLGAFLCPFFIALFFSGAPIWNAVLTTLWICLFLGLYLAYYPIKYKKLAYVVNDHALIIYCGVFYNRIKAIELRNIQRVIVGATPLQRAMRLSTVFVSGAGGAVYIPCLDADEAARLCARLSCAEGGGRDS